MEDVKKHLLEMAARHDEDAIDYKNRAKSNREAAERYDASAAECERQADQYREAAEKL